MSKLSYSAIGCYLLALAAGGSALARNRTIADSSAPGLPAATPADYRDWTLVWADEFDRDGAPDAGKWTYERGFVRNKEPQWYQPQNAVCRDGLLLIEARREIVPNPGYVPGSGDWKTARAQAEFSSASLTTKGMQGWTYGRFEARMRLDTRGGLWPAFWTVGDQKRIAPWPHSGEIDIMEFYGKQLLANVFWGGKSAGEMEIRDTRAPIANFNDKDWARRFHVWRMDWDEKAIRLYVDDVLLNETTLDQTVNRDSAGMNPYIDKPQFLILNLAVRPSDGKAPTAGFPGRLEVDYVRVYQRRKP